MWCFIRCNFSYIYYLLFYKLFLWIYPYNYYFSINYLRHSIYYWYIYICEEKEQSALNVSYFSIFVFGVLNVIIYMMTTRSGGQTLQCGDWFNCNLTNLTLLNQRQFIIFIYHGMTNFFRLMTKSTISIGMTEKNKWSEQLQWTNCKLIFPFFPFSLF